MSKKAKKMKANRKRRKTMLDTAKSEANNYKALADQYGAKVTELEAEVRKVTAQADEMSQRNRSLLDHKSSTFQTIADLKKIIAGLERETAERDGTIRELRRQIDQAAPKVMVRPAVFASPTEAGNQQMTIGGGDTNFGAFTRARDAETKKHWTAL